MLKQDMCITDKARNKLTIHGEGKTMRVLLDDLIYKMNDKKNKKFSAAINNDGINLFFPDNGNRSNRFLKKGVHSQMFLKNCDLEFKKSRYTDLICMAKSKDSNALMAEKLITSESNVGNMKNKIFEILSVSTMPKVLARLHKKQAGTFILLFRLLSLAFPVFLYIINK